jgi:hypothetical protein
VSLVGAKVKESEMIRKYITVFIFMSVAGLACLLLFTCSKKSTKPETPPPEPAPQMYVYPTYFNFGEMTSPVETTFTIMNTGGGVLSGVVGVDTAKGCECALLVPNDTTHYEALGYDFSAGQGANVGVRYFPVGFGRDEPGSHHHCRLLSVAEIPSGKILYEYIFLGGYRLRPEAVCSLSTYILDFDTVKVGDYKEKTFTITNIGPENSILSGKVELDCLDESAFGLTPGSGSYSLESGETKEVKVLFMPNYGMFLNCTIHVGSCGNVYCSGEGEH